MSSIAKLPEIVMSALPPSLVSLVAPCETLRKQATRSWLCAALAVFALAVASVPTVAAQHGQSSATPAGDGQAPSAASSAAPSAAHGPQPAAGGAHEAKTSDRAPVHSSEQEHAESPWTLVARWINFLLLAGGLYYFLRMPLSRHLTERSQRIRADLVAAQEMSARATTQLAEIDRKLEELPAELAALRARGEEEIAAERTRIEQRARAERQRLLEQTRRDIELQVRLAKRELTEHAAALAVALAHERIERTMTPEDQLRLIDRYVTQVRSAHE